MGEPVVDPAKFKTYMTQAGRATAPTIRQEMMGNFVDAMDKFHTGMDAAYKSVGLDNPYITPSLNSLKETLDRPSLGQRLGDLYYDRLIPQGLGEAVGGAAGYGAAAATGLKEAGFGGAYLGKWVLGPIFSSLIKPMMEYGYNMPGLKQSMGYLKSVIEGNDGLANSAASIFSGAAKTIPSKVGVQKKDIDELDDLLKNLGIHQDKLTSVSGDMGKYIPDHAQAVSQTALNAVNYLNSQRPVVSKQSPLDSDLPVSKPQKADFHRILTVAQQPLVAFEHLKRGTLTPQDVNTLKTIYPAYYQKMSHELMDAMVDHLGNGKVIPYRLRQSLSLFLEQPMDSTLSPNSIQAVQTMYGQIRPQQQAQNQMQGKTKKSTSKLDKLSTNLQTGDQARASRANQG
jgi:hypothetical protein